MPVTLDDFEVDFEAALKALTEEVLADMVKRAPSRRVDGKKAPPRRKRPRR